MISDFAVLEEGEITNDTILNLIEDELEEQ